MEAYYKEVCKLEKKFHGLELNHIADELAKITSTRGTIPPDMFSRDLLEPSVDLGTGAAFEAPAPEPVDTVEALLTAAEVMEVKQPS
jgi:hypothetical protein